ncbi:hypothetical protein A2230_08660 [candidate division WOR-1 bacterium RIFOXYA2_FULL_36_21]|uniref:YkuD domain-containing protein n=1 Tax=candidate division WOR-1 bacterium RIFOXYB2_FULL_36_35 TaxID=1802578 RepID=A0A1F4RY01_UNCSA|nr:MAG: hypothetical protein A2230_08660 [candidate division WOR-1 bacterium RIFOXYA2_FULL_36_21]OGC13027.1 MAG: hypothetical protein A2290_00435 [candidate division WOR-1 bacterium RIFOXYB2_FULL_36_35]OGC21001.1 MAG: hypothetical protein A2282_05795 [candidate division WOR-1 bacterium RIFOXYA12_FULL_36_13]
MRRIFISFLFILFFAIASYSQTYESISLINQTNFAQKFNDYLGYVYDSHGCLHFTPADIYLLTQTIPNGIELKIKDYKIKKEEYPDYLESIPYLVDITKDSDDIKKHKQLFNSSTTEVVVYPSLSKLVIKVNGIPYAKIDTLAGPEDEMLIAFDVVKEGLIEWDLMLTTPTDPGIYTILRSTDHYISSAYYQNTIVPFGAWILKKNGVWSFKENNKWYKLPQNVIDDLNRSANNRQYNYYDVILNKDGKVTAARYAGHDFGKYVLLWTVDGKNHYPEMGYAAGELLYEQIILVKDLVYLLTLQDDDFDAAVLKSKNFMMYKGLSDFIKSKGKVTSKEIPPRVYSYYRLYNGFELKPEDYKNMDSRVLKAFSEYKENRLPRDKVTREKELGLVHFLKVNSMVVDKEAAWYEKIKKDWDFWKNLKISAREDFKKMGILSLSNRQNLLEEWINKRLEFSVVTTPKQAKNLQDLTFSSFFKPSEENSVFDEREKEEMLKLVRETVKNDSAGLNLYSVDALNNYNFGVLLNDILGDLYKSHGCMHVSPRNSFFLYKFLPIGARVTIYDYSKKVDEKQFENVPYLADLINFIEDIPPLRERLSVTEEVQVEVYPTSGFWVIYLKEKPFAKLNVRGGPQAKMYLVHGRDDKGKPIFEDHLAYPTTPGTYYIFKKTEHYISNIYYPITVIGAGDIIKKDGNKFVFQNDKGIFVPVSDEIKADIEKPEKDREYTYYDTIKNISGEVISMRWGSHPFGRFALQISKDNKTMFPELIHSSGDLMMEERGIIDDLIKILSAPLDEVERCVKYSSNFDLYRACYEFVQNPNREDLIQVKERSSYKLYHGMELSSGEAASLHKDVIAANKVLKNQRLSESDVDALINSGAAYRRGGKFKINMEKVLGLQFDTYQYVVMVQKYAHHYKVLKDNWDELSELRKAMLKDFNNFVIKDPQVFHNFMKELMVRRTQMKRLSQKEAMDILVGMF